MLIDVGVVNQEVLLVTLKTMRGPILRLGRSVDGSRTQCADGSRLRGRTPRLEGDASPIGWAQQQTFGSDWLAQAIGEDGETGDMDLVEPLHHLGGELALYDSVLERIVVDQH